MLNTERAGGPACYISAVFTHYLSGSYNSALLTKLVISSTSLNKHIIKIIFDYYISEAVMARAILRDSDNVIKIRLIYAILCRNFFCLCLNMCLNIL